MTATDVVQLPYSYNLKLKQGADRTISLSLKNANGTPMSLVGYTSTLVIRSRYGGAALLTLTEVDGITIDGVNGTVAAVFTHVKTAGLSFETGVYDWYIKSAQNPPTYTYVLEGTVVLTPQVAV